LVIEKLHLSKVGMLLASTSSVKPLKKCLPTHLAGIGQTIPAQPCTLEYIVPCSAVEFDSTPWVQILSSRGGEKIIIRISVSYKVTFSYFQSSYQSLSETIGGN
jgi:hypothetical protein